MYLCVLIFITGTVEEVELCTPERTYPVSVVYNYTSQQLFVTLSQTLPTNTLIETYFCNNQTVREHLDQACSSIVFDLSSDATLGLIRIGFPATTSGCELLTSEDIYLGIDFSREGK